MHYEYSDTLTERDIKRHIAHEFEAPPKTARLSVRLTFTPEQVGAIRNMLCLTILGPDGFRGAGHRGGALHEVVIAPDHATPGYLPGPISPGRWSVVIDTHMVMPGEPCHYRLTIDVDSAATAPAPAPPASLQPTPARSGPAWFRGDLHAHTIHSDATWDVPDLLASARARRLDFVTLTDHNTISHLYHPAAQSAGGLLVMGGMELTTFWGHALSLGTREWIDWRVGRERTMPQIAAEVAQHGGLFIIAHPMSPGDPACTGCDWRYVEMMPGPARLVEIWNGLWAGDSNNEQALALWYSWLNQGIHITATCGTDAHGPAPDSARPGFNVVWADELSETGILAGVARGSLYISSGPALILSGRAGTIEAQNGGALPEGPIQLTVTWAESPVGAALRLIGGGALVDEILVDERDTLAWSIDDPARWYLIELRADDGELLAITNPIFIGEWAG